MCDLPTRSKPGFAEDGSLYFIDQETGESRWTFPVRRGGGWVVVVEREDGEGVRASFPQFLSAMHAKYSGRSRMFLQARER